MNRTTSTLWAFVLSSLPAVSALAEAEVYLLAGQSNMHGLGPVKELPPEGRKAPERVFFWNGNAFVPMVPGKTKTSGTAGCFGPEIGFAAGLAAARPGPPVYLIKFAIGAQPLHYGWKASGQWVGGPPAPNRMTFYPGENPDDPNAGVRYRQMRASFTKALAALDAAKVSYKIRGIVWMQGEADAHHKTAASDYPRMLRLLKTRLEQDLKATNLPLVYGQVLPYAPSSQERWFAARDDIRAQMQAADSRSGKPAAIPGAWMVPTDRFPLLKDHLHHNGVGQWRLGGAFAKAMLEAQRTAPR